MHTDQLLLHCLSSSKFLNFIIVKKQRFDTIESRETEQEFADSDRIKWLKRLAMPVREINIGSRGLQSNSTVSQQIGSGRFPVDWIFSPGGIFDVSRSIFGAIEIRRNSSIGTPRVVQDMGEERVKNGCKDFEKSKMTNLI